MGIHIIPDTEKKLHEESEDCPCEPTFKLDQESGEIVWLHSPIDWDELLKDFVQL